MKKIQDNYIEKLYSGWLGKIIGVRLGAPIEGWTYEKIKRVYGTVDGYLVDYKDFAADDDTNGPMFFIRALEDYNCSENLTADDIAKTWLNYAPYEHGFYWWGGYGISTEHTAYLNLRQGIQAPRSGSVEQNGATVAEQIGGQIFIDPWGLVAPANTDLAANLSEKAASVSHGGNGVYGGVFVATAISAAFEEKSMIDVVKRALSYVPKDSEYMRMATDVISFYEEKKGDWHACYRFIFDNYGYDRYCGACHIIPNSAVMILSLLYGEGDFSDTINICNMCGWDTDCNVGNVGTIIGVFAGLEGIDYDKWRKPINDFFCCSSVIGSLNIVDVPTSVAYLADKAYKLANEEIPDRYHDWITGKTAKFNFNLPGSTHGFRAKSSGTDYILLSNSSDSPKSGDGCLKVTTANMYTSCEVSVFHKTYYRPADLHDNRYDPGFSPIFYPGQTFEGYIRLGELLTGSVSKKYDPKTDSVEIVARGYAKDGNNDELIFGDTVILSDEWQKISVTVPYIDGACIEEVGVTFCLKGGHSDTITLYLDDFDICGKTNYTLNFKNEKVEDWFFNHKEVSQTCFLKGLWNVQSSKLVGSCHDYGEIYTGLIDWRDYKVEASITPLLGEFIGLNFRVGGGIHSYAAVLSPDNKLEIMKNNNGYTSIASTNFNWKHNEKYIIAAEVHGNSFDISINGTKLLCATDEDNSYQRGCVGISVRNGSKAEIDYITVNEC